MTVIDADGHVEENLHVFAAPYWDEPRLAGRKPRVIQGEGRPVFLIDDEVIPRVSGPGATIMGNPCRLDRSSPCFFQRPDPPDSAEFVDVQARIDQLAAESLDFQVLYPTLFLASPLTKDRALNAALCRSYNNWISDACRRHPTKFRWVAVTPLDDVPAAVREARRAVRELGAIGVMVLGTVRDLPMGRPEFDPFYEEVSNLGVPLAVHTGFSSPSVQQHFNIAFEAIQVSFLFGIFAAYVCMITNGVFDRFPTMKTAFLEAGSSWVPYWTERMEHYQKNAPLSRRSYKGRREPGEYLRRGQLYFSFEVDEGDLPTALQEIGEDQLLFASDIPHADRRPGAVRLLFERNDISDDVKEKLCRRNAMRFYGLPEV